LTNQTIYIIGEARTTMDNTITKMFGNFYIAFEMEVDKDKIIDVDCNATLRLTKDFVHRLFLNHNIIEDEELFSEIDSKISEKKCTAEFALNEAIDEYANMLANLEDAYFKERAGDLRDIGKRWLYGVMNVQVVDLSKLEPETIIVARELNPSDTAQINLENVLAFVTEIGGKTAHSSIMARSLELPAVVGVGTVLENLKNAGYQYEDAEITMIPENTVEITDLETAKKVMALYDALEDLDDSQNVYSNFDISDEILEQLD